MIEAENLRVTLARRPVLRDISLSIPAGALTVIAGPNGAGKTTLLRALTGDLAPAAGIIRFDGVPLDAWRNRTLAQRRAVLPQSSHLAFPFTVHEVVALGLRAGAHRAANPGQFIRDRLKRVGLAGYEGRFYQQLSGGEQQRVHLARVLSQLGAPMSEGAANWLYLDEPTASLDIRHQFEILDIARDHVARGGGCLAILHDLNLAADYADRLIVVDAGTIVADGAPDAVLTDDLVASVFGVAAERILLSRSRAAPCVDARPG